MNNPPVSIRKIARAAGVSTGLMHRNITAILSMQDILK